MTDDIVTRPQTRQTHLLRALALDLAHQGNNAGSLVADIAADEIERLEAEILEINLLWNADKAELERLRNV